MLQVLSHHYIQLQYTHTRVCLSVCAYEQVCVDVLISIYIYIYLIYTYSRMFIYTFIRRVITTRNINMLYTQARDYKYLIVFNIKRLR